MINKIVYKGLHRRGQKLPQVSCATHVLRAYITKVGFLEGNNGAIKALYLLICLWKQVQSSQELIPRKDHDVSYMSGVTTCIHSCVVILKHRLINPTLNPDIFNEKLWPLIRDIHSIRLPFSLPTRNIPKYKPFSHTSSTCNCWKLTLYPLLLICLILRPGVSTFSVKTLPFPLFFFFAGGWQQV